MSVIVKAKVGGTPPPSGLHKAVCAKVWDLGIQPGFQGKPQAKVAILWELDSRIEDGEMAGKRHIYTQTYTASLHEKARLRQDLEAWRGRGFTPEETQGFDIEKLIGVNCYVNLVEYTKQNGMPGVKMASIMPLKKGEDKIEPELPDDYMPQWIQDILGAPDRPDDYVESDDGDFKDDIPF